jgi:hypothetical protein
VVVIQLVCVHGKFGQLLQIGGAYIRLYITHGSVTMIDIIIFFLERIDIIIFPRKN